MTDDLKEICERIRNLGEIPDKAEAIAFDIELILEQKAKMNRLGFYF